MTDFIQHGTLTLKQALTRLSNREQFVIKHRLKGKTLKEIGFLIRPTPIGQKNKDTRGLRTIGVGAERVRGIEFKAIHKLKKFVRPPDKFSKLSDEIKELLSLKGETFEH